MEQDGNIGAEPLRNRRHRKTFLAHGDVPLVLLGLLSEHSMHGYEMIKSLEERSGGLYKPSAGAIYPTLAMLEDQELIESVQQGRKRVFSITVEGRDYLDQHQSRSSWRSLLTKAKEDVDAPAPMPDVSELRKSVKELFELFFVASSSVADDPAGIDRLREIIDGAQGDLESLINAR